MSIIVPDIEELVKAHMDEQPYTIKCTGCGNNLDCHVSIDSDYDLTIEVQPCETCVSNARDEGICNGI